jgi:cytochrome c551/c552
MQVLLGDGISMMLRIFAFITGFGLMIVPGLALGSAPGNSENGSRVLDAYGCLDCHRLGVAGSGAAGDLGNRRARDYSPSGLVSHIWNHAPSLSRSSASIDKPDLSEQDAADLFAFFLANRYFERPAEAARGRPIFLAKGCVACHEIGKIWPEMAASPAVTDPVALAVAFWNHRKRAAGLPKAKRSKHPQIDSKELGDVLLYLQSHPQTRRTTRTFSAGPATRGRAVAEAMCGSCHTGKRSLESYRGRLTLTDFAASMWNHGRRMKSPPDELNYEEMRAVIGYLWTARVFDDPGAARSGKRTFARRGCISCHEDRSSTLAGANYRKAVVDPIAMLRMVWQHTPAASSYASRQMWPRLRPSDIANLAAFLESRPAIPLTLASAETTASLEITRQHDSRPTANAPE